VVNSAIKSGQWIWIKVELNFAKKTKKMIFGEFWQNWFV